MRIAILCPGQMGDVCESTGLFAYAEELWGPTPEIHWYVREKFRQPLDRNPHVIVHPIGEREQALEAVRRSLLENNYNRVYHTAPWLNWALVMKIPLPRIPPRILGLARNRKWLPQIWLTAEEESAAAELVNRVPARHRVMLETECFSNQGKWVESMTEELAERTKADGVVFLTTSFGYAEKMRTMGITNVLSLDDLKYRQLAEAYNHCDMYVGVPSGAASVTCAVRCKTLPRIEYLTEQKCPKPGKVAPDWGTAAMRPCFHHWEPQKVLDKAVGIIHAMGRKTGRERRREKKAQERHLKRHARCHGVV